MTRPILPVTECRLDNAGPNPNRRNGSAMPEQRRPMFRYSVSSMYVIATGEYVKIGRSANPHARLPGFLTSNPYPIEVLAVVPECRRRDPGLSDPAAMWEEKAQWIWRDLHHRGEWFHRTPELEEWAASLPDRDPEWDGVVIGGEDDK